MVSEIFLATLATLLLLLSFFMIGLLINYLSNKPDLRKTSYDTVVVHTLVAQLALLVDITVATVIGLLYQNIPPEYLIVLTFFDHFVSYYFFTSVLVTLGVKLLFLSYPSKMLEKSDRKVTMKAMLARTLIMGFIIILDIVSPFKSDPQLFKLVQGVTEELQR